jgi:hypothetical protein
MKAKEGPHKHYLPGMGHDRLFPIYDPLHRLLGLGSAHRQLVDQADVRPGHRVLEIGCGTGTWRSSPSASIRKPRSSGWIPTRRRSPGPGEKPSARRSLCG